FLPLGFLVQKKIEEIIRNEMNSVGGQEILMPALHSKKNWETTGRWKYPEMFKLKNRSDKDFSLGWTHEEIITPLVKEFINSYKNLPFYAYQIQDKFRDELRAKSGLLRGVEFLMKDLYSFHADEKDLDSYYEKMKKAYFNIFDKCGLSTKTFLTLAAGGTFSKYSHEFQTLTTSGEDEIYLCKKCKLAVNKEIIKQEKNKCPKCGNKSLSVEKAIEIGNIFQLKDKFSKVFNLNFVGKDKKEKLVFMGCYGIGLSRLMGAIVEINHDDKGIIWPKEVAPFLVHLIQVENNQKINKAAFGLYEDFQKQGIEVLYDDRQDKSAGEKFVDADLIGLPLRIVVSERTLKLNSVELKFRDKKETKLMKIKDLGKFLNNYV
ncbi:MAG TPA: aminoacyl--tRNA ligase-related protein, partial [Candidatus Paceibacterota bacterium]|nr:aminoacyl--tRNA ligase-related protein [Candidatus Paceibacterota bacterium]